MPQPRPDVQIDDDFPERKPFGYYAKRAIAELIKMQNDPAERRAWIGIAMQHGSITAEEADALR